MITIQEEYKTKDCWLMQGDCLELMDNIPDKSVNLILCDLPYGVTQNKKDITLPFEDYIVLNGKNYTFQEFLEADLDINEATLVNYFKRNKKKGLWTHYNRIIKDNGAILLFGQGLFFIDLVNSNRKIYRYDLVWDKQLTSGFLNANRMPLRQHEQIAVFYKKLPTYNPQFTQGKPLHSKGVSYQNKEHKNQNYGDFHMTDDNRKGSTEKYPTSILSFQKPHPSVAKHRTEKPVELLKYLIRTYTNEGDTVLDNCMGSGSTVRAALFENRKAIGIELDKEYYNKTKTQILTLEDLSYA
ncbi:MAG: DNA-methyltransferase [Candidatus Gastranaerophilaceae bacterium]